MKNTIYQNLVNKPLKLCVLATATPQGKPECAVLAYAVNSDLSLILHILLQENGGILKQINR